MKVVEIAEKSVVSEGMTLAIDRVVVEPKLLVLTLHFHLKLDIFLKFETEQL